MLIPMIWSAIVALTTGVAVYCNCIDSNENDAVFFTSILAIGWAFAAMLLCIVM